MARSYGKSKGRSESRGFAGIPRAVMEHGDYMGLSASAKALLLELAYQYRGRNNGDLGIAWKVLRKRGWKSKATIQKARDELVQAGLIRCVREGRFMNPGGICSLYALTWEPLHREDLDLSPTARPLRVFGSPALCKVPVPDTGQGSPHIPGPRVAGGAS